MKEEQAVVLKLQKLISQCIEQLPDSEIKNILAKESDTSSRWLTAVVADIPYPETIMEPNTINIVYGRIGMFMNHIAATSSKFYQKTGDKIYEEIMNLTYYQYKWLDALRWDMPVPEV